MLFETGSSSASGCGHEIMCLFVSCDVQICLSVVEVYASWYEKSDNGKAVYALLAINAAFETVRALQQWLAAGTHLSSSRIFID